MSTFGYRKELHKYEDIDEDELLASLTSEELKELERELEDIDPDSNVPIGLRQKDQTEKTPTGTFSREALLKYWESETKKLLENERTAPGKSQEEEQEEVIDDSEDECVTENNSDASEEEAYTEDEEEEKEESPVTEEEDDEEECPVTEKEDDENKQGDVIDRMLHSTSKSSHEQNGQNQCNGKLGGSKNCTQETNEDPNLKVTASRPCGNPTVLDDTLEKIINNDLNTHEINLNNIENITKEMLIRFAEALKSNTIVKLFSLANTHADDYVAFAIAKMLTENKSIASLNIESNFVTGKGILAIMRALLNNTALTELRFHNQRHICGGQTEMEIAKLLKDNTTLLKLGYHFDLPGPRMSMTSILTRNQDRQRQKRLQEQKQQEVERREGSEGPVNPRTSVLQKGTPGSSPYTSPKGSPWSSPKVARNSQIKITVPCLPLPPPPPPPPLPEKKTPTRKIAEVIKLHEQSKAKQQTGQQKPKVRKSKKTERENNILKEFKHALKPISEKKADDRSRPSTPQRSLHDNLMAAICNSSIKQLKRVEVPECLR